MELLRFLSCCGVLVTLCLASVSCRKGYGDGEQDWGHIEVRKGAHLFYWLYYTTAEVKNYTERPLIIWLQGGPGESSTGKGNFMELGPLYTNGTKRNHTWIKDANVLFIDSPVGTGFSKVDSFDLLAKNNEDIANDLVSLMIGFYNLHAEFETVPLHIFGESYGGKVATEFALSLHKAHTRNLIKCNLVSVACGNSWISPIDTLQSWGPYLLHTGIVDEDGYNTIMTGTTAVEKDIANENWKAARSQVQEILNKIENLSFGVNLYYTDKPQRSDDSIYLTKLINSVAQALNQNQTTCCNFNSTINEAIVDIMKPVTGIVEELLNKTTIKVAIYSGNVDLICATPGTVNWISKMQWKNKENYLKAPRAPINVNDVLEGYKKVTPNFSMFWVKRAGHSVPEENPRAMKAILDEILKSS